MDAHTEGDFIETTDGDLGLSLAILSARNGYVSTPVEIGKHLHQVDQDEFFMSIITVRTLLSHVAVYYSCCILSVVFIIL